MKNQIRNLTPHRAAVAAMWVFADRYAAQEGGSMDFWDSLLQRDKDFCRRMVRRILAAPEEGSQ